jgi:DNA-binding NarL/FixJ family response regulator
LGPLQVIALTIPTGEHPAGRILAEVDRLEASRAVRVLDLLAVSKNGDDTLSVVSFGEDDDFGQLVSRLFPVAGASPGRSMDALEELWGRAQALPAGTAVTFLLVEHRWARGAFAALQQEGGSVLGAGLLTPELGLVIDAEVAAVEDGARSVAAAQASEAEARLRAIAAWREADEAVAASARVQSAAAAEVLQTLTNAGLVEAAALDEAVDALSEAGLIAAADEAAGERLSQDAAAIAAADEKAAEARQAASVTPAELRVLRYLPTDLSFALIADKLGISRQAAKDRAERAYKKLGVHDRASAVRKARALHVLP